MRHTGSGTAQLVWLVGQEAGGQQPVGQVSWLP